ncbi:MAG: hypothetical protein IKI97_11305 [Clostridia bacterium]|nr:hypothetical protein [Clostridia bacterium]
MNDKKNKEKKKEHPSAYAFLTNPVASVNEFTGYGTKLPLSDEEADSLSDMFEDVPTEESRFSNDVDDTKKNRNTVK